MAQCSKCQQNRPIVNIRRQLCSECNFERLHNGASRAEIYKERVQQRVESKVPRKKKLQSIGQSLKEKQIKEQLATLKQAIEQQAIDEGRYYCWGCGKSSTGLDKSHILSVKQRKDLELEKENINLFCRKCHNDWESGSIEKMLSLNTFEKDFEYIMQHDSTRFNAILLKIEDFAAYVFGGSVIREVKLETREKIEYFMSNYTYIEKK